MFKKLFKQRKHTQAGFTLLEILVVVAIMGFLVAMVAPRFAGIVGETEDVVCDSNQQRLVAAISTFYETKSGRYPNRLVNLVDKAGDATTGVIAEYRMPTTTRATDPDLGPATFAEDFDEHHWFQIHILNEAEADELRRNLGIVTVFNLNAYNYEGLPAGAVNYETEAYRDDNRGNAGLMTTVATDDRQDFMQQVDVAENLGVLMVGMGAVNSGATILNVGGATAADEHTEADHLGLNDSIGRIVMGVGPENSLIREGMITAAGLCPAGLPGDKFTWNHYSILLPRLEATVARMPDWAKEVSAGAEEGTGIIRENISLTDTHSWSFATACPEGHSWPETDELDGWMLRMNAQWTDPTP